MGTLGRTDEPRRFLESLALQTCRNARLIVVDQNPDDRLVAVIAAFESDIPILHLHSEVGLSRARNAGLRHVQADLVAFPDDDCWYPPDLLERVTRVLAERPLLDGVHGRGVEPTDDWWARRPPAGRNDSLQPMGSSGPRTCSSFVDASSTPLARSTRCSGSDQRDLGRSGGLGLRAALPELGLFAPIRSEPARPPPEKARALVATGCRGCLRVRDGHGQGLEKGSPTGVVRVLHVRSRLRGGARRACTGQTGSRAVLLGGGSWSAPRVARVAESRIS